MVYVIAAYHDIEDNLNSRNQEKVSSEMILSDKNLNNFFNEEEIKVMAEAILDHRAILEYEPKNIYGKILSSADKDTIVDVPLRRTYEYIKKHNQNDTLEKIIKESRKYIIDKYGIDENVKEKMYFEDDEYKNFLKDISNLAGNKEKFIKRYILINKIYSNESICEFFNKIKTENPTMSLDELIYETYKKMKLENERFDVFRNKILNAIGIDEIDYYTTNVNPILKKYIENNIFPQYEFNDKGHGIVHIVEVIRRAFALNDTFKLKLDDNIIYAIASYHDLGKYEDHKTHEKIAANRFINDDEMKCFFTNEQRIIIKEAIEDHRSSKDDEPRSIYGKLISSSDRNTRIEIVFIRSFFVGQERMPETYVEDYLDYTIERLTKKYDQENPENMFFEDKIYSEFIEDMRALLKNKSEFKNRYCNVNCIISRKHRVCDEIGEVSYTKRLKFIK
jgi:uncharacterized protein